MFTKYQLKDISYVPYDENAPEVATEAIRLISGELGGYKIYHFGSTSVPGMPGKNIINLFISSPIDDFEKVLKQLERIGLTDHPYRKEPPNRPLKVAENEYRGRKYGIHVHVLENGSRNEKNALYFRDYLIAHPKAAKEYANLKEKVLRESNNDPEIYRQEKNVFIRSILEKTDKV